MTLIEIFCRNLRMFLTLKGETYASLARLCEGKISPATIMNLKDPKKSNPSLNIIAGIADALQISPKYLLDQNFNYQGLTAPFKGYVQRECVLSDVQNERVKNWEKRNLDKITQLKQLAKEEYIAREKKYLP